MNDLLHELRNDTHDPERAWDRLTDEQKSKALALHGKQPIPNVGLYSTEAFEEKLKTWATCVRTVEPEGSGAAFLAIAVHGRPESHTT